MGLAIAGLRIGHLPFKQRLIRAAKHSGVGSVRRHSGGQPGGLWI
jgi:hypothetical protein